MAENTCIDCGKPISRQAKFCKSCWQKGERNSRWKGGERPCEECGCLTPKLRRGKWCRSCFRRWRYKTDEKYRENHKATVKLDGKIKSWAKGKKCADCGKPITSKATRCKSCFSKWAIEEFQGGLRKENNPNWKGGVKRRESQLGRSTQQYLAYRQAVLDLYENLCGACGKDGHLIVHHYHYPYAQFPDYRMDLANGVPMHWKCHYLYADGIKYG